MTNEPIFKLVDASTEEQEGFIKKLQALIEETNIYFEYVPQFTRETVKSPWEIKVVRLLMKMVPDESNEPIPSPFTDENNKKD